MATVSQELRFSALMRGLEELKMRLDNAGAASQLAHSSFDSGPGLGIAEMDPETGLPVAQFGTQFDGSHGAVVFTGPIPPVPTAPLRRTGPGTVTLGWDGVFVNIEGSRDFTVVPTMDMTHVEVHISDDPNFTAEFAETLVGTINTMRGGWVAAVTGAGTFYARLVSRSSAGKKSAASAVTSFTVTGVNVDELREEWESADNALGIALNNSTQAQQGLNAQLTGLKSALDAPNLETITGQQIAARVGLFMEVGVDKLVAGSADLGTAVADKIFTNLFSTRKLTADQVLIGQAGNLIVDGDFTDVTLMNQRLSNLNFAPPGPGRTPWEIVPAAGNELAGLRTVSSGLGTSTPATVFWAGSTTQPTIASAVQVKPGERLTLFGWVTTTAAASVTWQMMSFNNAAPAGTSSTSTVVSTVQSGATTGRRWVRAEYTVPATGVTSIYPQLFFSNQDSNPNTITVWGGCSMRRMEQEALVLFSDSTVSGVPYDLRITAGSGNATTPGVRFSYRRKDMQDVPPAVDAGVFATTPSGTGVGAQLQSSAITNTTNSPFSRFFTDPGAAGMEVRNTGTPTQRALLDATPNAFNLRTLEGVSDLFSSVRTDGDGVLDLYGKEGVTIGGSATSKPLISTGAWTHNGNMTVSNNLQAASISTTSPQSKAVEYTWSRSIGNAAASTPTSLTYVAAASNIADGQLATKSGSTGALTIIQSGIFSVTFTVKGTVAMTGRSYVEIDDVRSNIMAGEDSGSVHVTRYYAAGQVISFGVFQTSGGTRTMPGRVILVRHP